MMDSVKKAYAYQEALALSGKVITICEEFSDRDQNVLVWHLRQAVIDIPSSIAADLIHHRGATLEPIIKLATELELVHKNYPAIDTGKAPKMLSDLFDRMSSDRFNEREPEPEDEEGAGNQPAGGTVLEAENDGSSHQVRPTIDTVSPGTIQVNTQE
jgi:hypothetical protein